MFFDTEFSSYEIIKNKKLIRRLNGKNDPTSRQGKDGEWRSYESISSISEQERVLITWRVEDGVAKCTHTSEVRSVRRK